MQFLGYVYKTGKGEVLQMDRSPAPRFHTATESAWRLLYEGYSEFLAAFRVAAAKLKAGDRAAPFPRGSFPPGLPFVTA